MVTCSWKNNKNTDNGSKNINNDSIVKTINNFQNKQFYRYFNDTVYLLREFKIIQNKYVIDLLDMDYFMFHIAKFEMTGDSILILFVDKECDYIRYFLHDEIQTYDIISKGREKMTMVKNRQTNIWRTYFNDHFEYPYKYELIDSVDMVKSNYWIETEDW
jgi:hypothetical protein